MHEALKATMSKRKRWLLGVGFLLILVFLWYLLSLIIGKNYLLPSPWTVLQSIMENWHELWTQHLPATLAVMGVGCGASVILGILFAILMDLHAGIERAVYPLLTFTQTIPVLCLAPVLVLWLGYSFLMRVVVVVLVTFFSVTVNVFDGFRSVRAGRTELLTTYGASRWQQYRMLRFPTALPHLFTALRTVIPWAAVGSVIAEWLGAPNGVGVYSKSAMMSMNAAGLLAPLVLLSVIVLLVNGVLRLVELRIAIKRNGNEIG